ncbi:hypothetical protein ALMP_24000 [Streptomyces sp. A012304]|nr:hypothetical protein ALMP_24000 [Streptomyces sp. A012304]
MAYEAPEPPQDGTTNVLIGDAVNVVQGRDVKGHIIFAGGSGTPWPAFAWLAASLALSAGAGGCGWFALDGMAAVEPSPWTWVLAGTALLCLGAAGWSLRGCAAAWRRYRSLGMRHRLAVAADHLAQAGTRIWTREEKNRRLYDPKALPVRWRTDTALSDRWEIVRDTKNIAPGDLEGRFADVLRVFRTVPARRLVVLGGPGSGKSVLAVRFLLDHLADRLEHRPTEPVAVLLPLSSWNPSQPFRDWAVGRIALDHPQLADMGGTGTSAAAELLDHGRLLLVLDGLDELPAAARPKVIEALNEMRDSAKGGQVLLTSRRAEYREAVRAAGVLRAAAVVELEPLGTEELRRFLPLTVDKRVREDKPAEGDGRARGSTAGSDHSEGPGTSDGEARSAGSDGADGPDGPDGADGAKWGRVLAAVCDTVPAVGPLRRRHAAVLRQVLSTPLMIALARTAYSDTPRSPSELLDRRRFRDAERVEDHLLDQFVATVYRPAPGSYAAPADRWTGDEAKDWLTALAGRLQRLGLREITWWRLSPGVPEFGRLALESAALALTLGVTAWLVFGQPPRPQAPPPPYVLAVQAAACLIALLTRPFAGPDTGIAPRRVAVRGRLGSFIEQVMYATPVVLAIGLPLQVTPAVLAALPLLFASRVFVDHAVDVATAGSPRELLRADRRAVAFLAPGYALRGEGPNALRTWLLAWAALGPLLVTAAWHRGGGRPVVGPLVWTTTALGSLLALVLLGVAGSAWCGYTVTRVVLASTGRLPWALADFLEDAHRRGVLRQAGGVYEFRHARLQDRLAGRPAPEPAGPGVRLPLPPPTANLAALPVALVTLVALSFTPGASGPYTLAHVWCPPLGLPEGTVLKEAGRKGDETYECGWSGETKAEDAPLLDLGGWPLARVPDSGYVGSYGVHLTLHVMRPRYSRSAVEVATDYYDLLREGVGATRPVSGLGQEAVISGGGSPTDLVVRVDNMVITTLVVDSRGACRRTSDETALSLTGEVLRYLNLSEGRPRLDEPIPSACGGPSREPVEETVEETPPAPPPTPDPTPSPSAERPPLPTELRIDDDGVKRTHECRGGAVSVYGDDVTLTLLGSCGEVYLWGEGARVWVTHTDVLGLTGDNNSVYCQEPADEVVEYPSSYGGPVSGMAINCRS